MHCARSGLETLSKCAGGLGAWLRRLLAKHATKRGRRIVIVALAARLALVMQAMLSSGQAFRVAGAAESGPLRTGPRAQGALAV